MSTFHKATRHKKHSEECPLHFILPASLFYMKAPKLETAAFRKDVHIPKKQCIYLTKNCWINACDEMSVPSDSSKWNRGMCLRIILLLRACVLACSFKFQFMLVDLSKCKLSNIYTFFFNVMIISNTQMKFKLYNHFYMPVCQVPRPCLRNSNGLMSALTWKQQEKHCVYI